MTVKTDGYARVGWATVDFQAGIQLGNDENSYAFDGYLVKCLHFDVIARHAFLRPENGTTTRTLLVRRGRSAIP